MLENGNLESYIGHTDTINEDL